jgi:hypothetical protein
VSDGCHIGVFDTNKEFIANSFTAEYLVITWEKLTTGTIPLTALFERGVGTSVQYYCRAPYANGMLLGRMQAGSNQCLVPYVNGQSQKELPLNSGVEVLVNPTGGGIPLAYQDGFIITDLPLPNVGGNTADAIAAGKDGLTGDILYSCADNSGGPGTLRKGRGCYTTINGQVVNSLPYKMLVPAWLPNWAFSTDPPVFDFPAGMDNNGNPLYICRASDGAGVMRPGAIGRYWGPCQVGYSGFVHYPGNFDLLTHGGKI